MATHNGLQRIIIATSLCLCAAAAAQQRPHTPSARLRCTARYDGRPGPGRVEVYQADLRVVAGRCEGGALAVPAGPLRVHIIGDWALDAPTSAHLIDARSGEVSKIDAFFETGLLQVQRSEGALTGAATFEISRQGLVLAELPAGPPVRLSAGTYGVRVKAQGAPEVDFPSVHIEPKGRRVLVVHHGARGEGP